MRCSYQTVKYSVKSTSKLVELSEGGYAFSSTILDKAGCHLERNKCTKKRVKMQIKKMEINSG